MHVPVMVGEVLRYLITDPAGTYLDLNVGLGGHAEAVCRALDGGFRYIGIDLDPRALRLAQERLRPFGDKVMLLEGNHAEFPRLIRSEGIESVSGAFFDLGLSSEQLDSTSRGLSYERSAPLDMRYGTRGKTAAQLLAEIDERSLAEAFKTYGDLGAAARLARAIIRHREQFPLRSTQDLRRMVQKTLRPKPASRRKVLSQVFQAIRYLTNNEVSSFRDALGAVHEFLVPGGALCVISYESVTDRLAKREMHPPEVARDEYGRSLRPPRWERLTRRALRPSVSEVQRNPRARSARFRAARKLEVPSA